MTKPLTTVLAEALRLDEDARAELAAELLANLDGPADPDGRHANRVNKIHGIEGGKTGR